MGLGRVCAHRARDVRRRSSATSDLLLLAVGRPAASFCCAAGRSVVQNGFVVQSRSARPFASRSSTSIAIAARFGRIFLGEHFINTEMVRDGFAWRYGQYDKPGEFTSAENDAREHRRGLWADRDPVPPWEWRRERQAASGKR